MKEFLELYREVSAYVGQASMASVVDWKKSLRQDSFLSSQYAAVMEGLGQVYTVHEPEKSSSLPIAKKELTLLTWNIERGKRWSEASATIQSHADMKDFDLILLTEVDWGMARSSNVCVAEELGRALDCYAYFVPAYFNLTLGHGVERGISGQNQIGLHGQAILSRWPLSHLTAFSLPNATDKLASREARLGHKRALYGTLDWQGSDLGVVCVHLDAFSSPKARRQQMKALLEHCPTDLPVIVGGDWNTNSLDATSGWQLAASVTRRVLHPGPLAMIREYFVRPYHYFDKPLFRLLKEHGFTCEGFNEEKEGTFDVYYNDTELGFMAMDQFPRWILEWISRQIQRQGGKISMKLDWFAGKGIYPTDARVIRLNTNLSQRISDHQPIRLVISK